MTVGELNARISLEELNLWKAYYVLEQEEMDHKREHAGS